MFQGWSWWSAVIAALLGALGVLFGASGCQPTATDFATMQQDMAKVGSAAETLEQRIGKSVPVGLPAEYADLVAKLGEIAKDQGVLEAMTAKMAGAGQDMALGLWIVSQNFVGLGFKGVNVELMADADLAGTQLPPGVREQFIAILKDPDIPQEVKDNIIVLLTWNRQQE